MKWLYNRPGAPTGLPSVLYFSPTAKSSKGIYEETVPKCYTAHRAPELEAIYCRIKTGRSFSRLAQSLDMACIVPPGKLRYLIANGGALGLAMDPQDYENEFGYQISTQKRVDSIFTMRTCAAFVYELQLSIRAIQRKANRKWARRINWDLEGKEFLKFMSRAVKQLQGPFKPERRLKMIKLLDQKSGSQKVPLATRAVDVLLALANELQRVPKRSELKNRLVMLHPSLKMKKIEKEELMKMTATKKIEMEKKIKNQDKTFWSEQLKIAGLATL